MNITKTPIQHAIQYTLFISVLYIVFKFFDINSPTGSQFISYIVPMLFTDIIIIVFPLLFVFFYFKDGSAINEIKENIWERDNAQTNGINSSEILREHHTMLKEGIITQEEFDIIKKKYLKESLADSNKRLII